MNKVQTIIIVGLLAILSWIVLNPTTKTETVREPRNPIVMAAGDSITEGSALQYKNGSWPNLLSKKLGYQVTNVAHGGQGLINLGYPYGNLVDTFPHEILDAPIKPDIVVIGIGINDIRSHPNERLYEAYREIQAMADRENIEVFWLSITPYGKPEIVEVNGWLEETFGGHYIDTYTHLVGPDGLLKPEYDIGDRIHPNELGTRMIADIVDRHLWESGITYPSEDLCENNKGAKLCRG